MLQQGLPTHWAAPELGMELMGLIFFYPPHPEHFPWQSCWQGSSSPVELNPWHIAAKLASDTACVGDAAPVGEGSISLSLGGHCRRDPGADHLQDLA